MRSRLPVLSALIAVPLLGLPLAGPAVAHVGGSPSAATAGSGVVLTLDVQHGCGDSPTTRLEIKVPEQLLAVTPTRNPGWDVEVVRADLDEPVTDAHGNEVTDRVDRVVFSAAEPLPDGQRDNFELSFQVPDAAGEVLAFPTVQTCRDGETAWVEVPADGQDPHELEAPAPTLEIVAGDPGDPGEADSQDAEGAGEADAGSDVLGWAGLVAGLLGLAAGVTALARRR